MIKLTIDQFIQKAREVHGDKYNYSLIEYENNTTKVKIICPIHGVFKIAPAKHMRGQGCKQCGYISTKNKQRFTTDQFIQKAKEVHGDRYDYSLVEYKNKETKVKIICPVHGVFEQIPNNHIRGEGCNQCGNILASEKNKRDRSSIIEQARQVHGDKYDYTFIEFDKINDKVTIICSIHGTFEQKLSNHIHLKHGCPKCASMISKQETEFQNWLSGYIDIETNSRSIIPPYELDVVIPSKKIAIEYNGLYWHSESAGKNKSYHLLKYQLCKEAGFRLIQIWENEWTQKKDIVKSIILSAIGIYERKIGARQCNIENIDVTTARQFYDNNHIQGFYGGKHKGLLYKGELVSMMTIKYHDNHCSLERFVNKRGYRVMGAFSKLLKSFNIDKPIETFSDLRYFTGGVYSKNGFTFLYNSDPNYFYFKNGSSILFHRRYFQKHKLSRRLKSFNNEMSEYENMLFNGYHRIWDCGNAKFVIE